MIDPTGSTACSGSSELNRCGLAATGSYTVVLDDDSQSDTGAYALEPKRLAEHDRLFAAAVDRLRDLRIQRQHRHRRRSRLLRRQGRRGRQADTGDQRSGIHVALVDGNGQFTCGTSWYGQCTASGPAPYQMLVWADGITTSTYKVSASCDNVPCGQSDTAVLDATPKSVGKAEQATVTLRGRDLDLLKSAKFVRGDATLTVTLGAAALDGRTRPASVNTDTAPTGDYSLVAEFLDGSTRTLAAALTVTTTVPPNVRLALVGRPVFRTGVATTVTVQASNAGNVDARGVSLILGGMPAGATLQPEGGVRRVSGPAGAPVFEQASLDAATSTVTTPGGVVAPFYLSRVPAARACRSAST